MREGRRSEALVAGLLLDRLFAGEWRSREERERIRELTSGGEIRCKISQGLTEVNLSVSTRQSSKDFDDLDDRSEEATREQG